MDRAKKLTLALRAVVYFLFFVILVAAMLASSGCKTQEKVVTKTEYVQDSTAILQLQQEKDSLREISSRYRSEVTTLETQLASTTTGSGEKDSTLPVQSFRTENGPHYFSLLYQGNLVEWTLHIAQQQSRITETKDSSSYLRTRLTSLQDSIANMQKRASDKTSETTITKKPGFFERLWITIKNGWWLLIVGAVVYTVLREQIPFLP